MVVDEGQRKGSEVTQSDIPQAAVEVGAWGKWPL